MPERPKKGFGKFFKSLALLFFFGIILSSLVYVFPHFKTALKREVFITAQGQTMGLVFPSAAPVNHRVNLLFLGIPGEGYIGENMTDTIIIVNSGTKGENPIGISIPRDLLVKAPSQDYYTKINALYGLGKDKEQGVELIKSAIKEVAGLDIDYFIVFDLEGVKNIIDSLGGIDVVVEKDIYDPNFPAPYNSYETFSLKRGVHHLDGETALKYLRSRNAPEGDFSRIKRQQEVINILKNKITSLNFFWDFPIILSVWKNFTSHTYTNIDVTEIKYAWNLISKTNLETIKFATLDMQENQLLNNGTMVLNGLNAYILEPKVGRDNFSAIQAYVKNLIGD